MEKQEKKKTTSLQEQKKKWEFIYFSEEEKWIEQLEKRIKELEMKEVAYNIMLEIIKEEYGIDLKKNMVSSGRKYER